MPNVIIIRIVYIVCQIASLLIADVDECALNLHNCGERLDCVNIRGSFRCIPKLCEDGYFTDATGGCIGNVLLLN